jgi:hypothetical protein
MNKPCGECPFTNKSLGGFLPGYGSAFRLHSFVMSEAYFPCHMQLPKGAGSIPMEMARFHPRCAGSLIYMKKACKFPENRKLKLLLDEVTPEEKELVMSVPEFMKHHELAKDDE